MQAIFYTTSKRHNSTLIPTGGVEMEVYLKENTNLINPTFILESGAIPAYSMMSYAGRYYFISSYSSISAMAWEVNCVCDVLASYAAQIKATTAFVLYSSSDYDLNVFDNRILNTAELSVYTATMEIPARVDNVNFFIGVIGNRTKTVSGFVDYYILNASEMTELSDVFYNNADLIEELKQYFTEPMSAIVSCKAGNIVPFSTQRQSLYLGAYDTGISARVLHSSVDSISAVLTVPLSYPDFRKLPPFTQLYLFLPYVGVIPLSPSQLIGSNATPEEPVQISVRMTKDYVTGEVVYSVKRITGERLGIYVGQFLYDIPVSQIQQNTGAILGGVIDLIDGGSAVALSQGQVGGSGVASGIMNILGGALRQTPSMTGGSGGSAMSSDEFKNIELYCFQYGTRNDMENMRAIAGNANMKVRQIEGLTGYCQTSGFSVSGAMTDTERNQINQLMDGGVYIE